MLQITLHCFLETSRIDGSMDARLSFYFGVLWELLCTFCFDFFPRADFMFRFEFQIQIRWVSYLVFHDSERERSREGDREMLEINQIHKFREMMHQYENHFNFIIFFPLLWCFESTQGRINHSFHWDFPLPGGGIPVMSAIGIFS